VIFTDPKLNDEPHNILKVISQLASSVENCFVWWADIGFIVQRLRYLAGAEHPWSLMLQIKNYGRTEEEARKFWGESLRRLCLAAQDFRLTAIS
jgi:hypothetical protein